MGIGFHEGVENTAYRAVKDHVSVSELKLFNYSPYKYKCEVLEGKKKDSSKSQQLGTLFHMALLEPEVFKTNVVAFSDLRSKAAYSTRSMGMEICRSDDYHSIVAARDEVLKNDYVRSTLEGAKKELSAFWAHPIGLKCKCRFDAINLEKKIILDVKTCRDLAEFKRQINWYGYAMQAAFYTDCAKAITGDDFTFQFLAVELDAPYLYKVFEVSNGLYLESKAKYENILEKYKYSFDNNYYPHPSEEIEVLEPQGGLQNMYDIIEELPK